MRNIITSILLFTAGAGIGSAVTWKLLKTKYEKIAQEEIDSVKEVYSKRASVAANPKPIEGEGVEEIHIPEKPDIMEYAAKLKEEGYMDYSTNGKDEQKEKEEEKEPYTSDMDGYSYDEEPYVITPEHFGEYDDYETQILTLYNDGYLVDDDDNEIVDIADVVGEDFKEHIGDFEDDAVHIRNEKYKTDFEVLVVERNFNEEAPVDGEE